MSESQNYPFRLEQSPKKKGICPNCGHDGQFRFYEDLNGNRLEEFGRCERVNSCGYHVWPTGKAVPKTPGDYVPPPMPVQIYPDRLQKKKFEDYLIDQESNFHRFCVGLGISYEHLAKWRVGTEERPGKGLLTVFVFVDHHNEIVNAKWFQYHSTGKRNKDFESHSLRQPTEKEGDEAPKRYGMCIYGEHLLDPERKRIVCLVESEKTAVIASWFYPYFDWAAVGSCNGLTDSKIQVLAGREIYWLADADGDEINKEEVKKKSAEPKLTYGGRRNSSIKKLQAYEFKYEVLDLYPNRKDGFDIADGIREQLWPFTELPEQEKPYLKEVTDNEDDDDESSQNVEEDFGDEWDFVVGIDKAFFYRADTQKHFRRFGFIEHRSRYWFGSITTKDEIKTLSFRSVSNCIVKPLLLIDSNDPKRIYEIFNIFGDSRLKAFSPKEFTTPQGFTEQVESLGNFWIHTSKSQFNKIKIKLYELCQSASEVKTLGYHKDGFYAFSNGIQGDEWVPLDKNGFGIVEHKGQRYFIPALSKINPNDSDDFENHKKFTMDKPINVTPFEEYTKRFCEVYNVNGNGQIGLMYYISCLFRDIVYSRFRFFPHLFLFGPPQSGKSSIAWSIMRLFGEPRNPFMLNTGTAVAFYKQFAEFQNSVVWFDEYQNSIDYPRIQSLKTAYDGAGHTKSENTKDNRNRSIPVKSGCIISGQELPTADNALFTRCILLQFTKTDFTQEEKDLHSRFFQEIESLGVSYFTAHLSQFREHFQANYIKHFDYEFSQLKMHFSKWGIDDRITKNMSILLSTYNCLSEHIKFPFSIEDLRKSAYALVASQNNLISGNKETSMFWKMVMFMSRSRQIKIKVDFRIDEKTFLDVDTPRGAEELRINLVSEENPQGRKVLFIRITNIHTFYQKLCRERGEKAMDEGSLRHYLTNQKGYLAKVRGLKFGKVSSTALAFDYEYLTETIEDFSLEDMDEELASISPKEDTGF